MKNIILIGFMGSGKTAVGKTLAKKLKMKYIDLDEKIISMEKMKINDIFSKYGEKYFRTLETKAATQAVKTGGKVIATGGGIVTQKANLALLKAGGIKIYLKNSFATSKKRLKNVNDRPLFKDMKKARELFTKRLVIYEKWADEKVVTDKREVEEVVDIIIRKAEKYNA